MASTDDVGPATPDGGSRRPSAAPPVAVVTGASGAIGGAIAVALGRAGYLVVGFERRAPAAGTVDHHLSVDMGDAAAVTAAVTEILERFGSIEVLVNNAALTGTLARATVLETDDDTLTRILAVNLAGPFVCAREVGRAMVAAGRGVIVNIGSVAGHRAQYGAAAYSATKAGLTGLTRALATELGPRGVRCVQLDPGDIRTPGSDEMTAQIAAAGHQPGVEGLPPVGRQGTPGEMGATVVFLVSPEAAFVNGAVLVADGGYLGAG